MSRLLKTRGLLEARRDELSERLARIHHDRQRVGDPLSPDFSDQATQRENDEVLDRLDEATVIELEQTKHALDRLERGLYGHCARCGEAIETQRLNAVPEATTCIRCAAPSRNRAASDHPERSTAH